MIIDQFLKLILCQFTFRFYVCCALYRTIRIDEIIVTWYGPIRAKKCAWRWLKVSRAWHWFHVSRAWHWFRVSRAWHWFHVSRAFHLWHDFPLSTLVTCSPARAQLATVSRVWHLLQVSRSWHGLHVCHAFHQLHDFLLLAPVTSFSRSLRASRCTSYVSFPRFSLVTLFSSIATSYASTSDWFAIYNPHILAVLT